VEALGCLLAGRELLITHVDVRRQQVGAQRIGSCDEHARHPQHVGCKARRVERIDELLCRHQHLATQVSALLLARKLIFEVHCRGACLDHSLHQLVRVQHATKASLGIGDDRHMPVNARIQTLAPLNRVGTAQRIVDALHVRGNAVRRVE